MNFKMEMRGFFMHSVCLPEKITEHFTCLSGRVLELKRQNGDTYHVGLIGSGGKLILQPGWSSFVSANNISQNDLLLFKFMGGSKFEVQIFDPTGCEKINDPELNSASKITSWEPDNSYVEETSEVKKTLPPTKGWNQKLCKPHLKRQRKGYGHCSYNKEEETMCYELKDKVMKQPQSCLGIEETSRRSILEKKGLTNPSMNKRASIYVREKVKQDQFEKPDSQTGKPRSGSTNKKNELIKSPYIVPKSVSLTSAQEKIALKMSRNALPGNPTFIRTLNQCNVSVEKSCQINFPPKFAPSLKETKSQRLNLRRYGKDKEWNARYFSSYPRGICSVGLRDFILENKLKKGDLCLFELMENEPKLTMMVHVFRM